MHYVALGVSTTVAMNAVKNLKSLGSAEEERLVSYTHQYITLSSLVTNFIHTEHPIQCLPGSMQ